MYPRPCLMDRRRCFRYKVARRHRGLFAVFQFYRQRLPRLGKHEHLERVRPVVPLLTMATDWHARCLRKMTEPDKIVSLLLPAVATILLLGSGTGCDRSSGGTSFTPDGEVEARSSLPSPTPEPTAAPAQATATPSPTPAPTTTQVPSPTQTPAPTTTPVPSPTQTPSPTTTPVPTPTSTTTPTASSDERRWTSEELKRWESKALVLLDDLDVLTYWGINRVEARIELAIVCERDMALVERILTENGIPSGAIALHVVKMDVDWGPDEFYCIPPEVVDPVTGISKPGFGGFDVEDDVAYIYLLEPSQELGEKLVTDETTSSWVEEKGEVRVLQGRYTWEQLVEWYELIRGGAWHPGTNLRTKPLVTRYNRIELERRYGFDPLDTPKIEEELSRLGVPCDAVFLSEESEAARWEEIRINDELSKTSLCDSVALLEE